MTRTVLREGLPPLPQRLRGLRVDARGYPVPFFVMWTNGKPDFRVIDPERYLTCVHQNRCWICGDPLGRFMSFVVGPICTVNHMSAEPPSHRDCAVFAAMACPFLVLPKSIRRDAGLEALPHKSMPGTMLEHNPGITAIWVTQSYKRVKVENGTLFHVGPPDECLWYCEGRLATRQEVVDALEKSLPILVEAAGIKSAAVVAQVRQQFVEALTLLPA